MNKQDQQSRQPAKQPSDAITTKRTITTCKEQAPEAKQDKTSQCKLPQSNLPTLNKHTKLPKQTKNS